MLEKIYISEKFFTEDELKAFREKFGHDIKEISYSSKSEIDFSELEEKKYLLENGHPMILARFFA